MPMYPYAQGRFFLTDMIIKEKNYPSEKRVLFVAIASQGCCFGTLFSVSVVKLNLITMSTIKLVHSIKDFSQVGGI